MHAIKRGSTQTDLPKSLDPLQEDFLKFMSMLDSNSQMDAIAAMNIIMTKYMATAGIP
jgi:hypothetical protein